MRGQLRHDFLRDADLDHEDGSQRQHAPWHQQRRLRTGELPAEHPRVRCDEAGSGGRDADGEREPRWEGERDLHICVRGTWVHDVRDDRKGCLFT